MPAIPKQRLRMLAAAIGTLGVSVAIAVAAPGARAGMTHAVQIIDFAFAPATLTVTVGDTVTWTNMDQVVHTATSTSGAFDSGDLGQGESYSLTFTAAGTYDYLCTPHPSMTGQVVVEPAAAPAPTAAPAVGGGIPNVATTAPTSKAALTIIGSVLLLAALLIAPYGARRGSPTG
jgi:amicyanin